MTFTASYALLGQQFQQTHLESFSCPRPATRAMRLLDLLNVLVGFFPTSNAFVVQGICGERPVTTLPISMLVFVYGSGVRILRP